MPISYRIDNAQGVVYTHGSGLVTDNEILKHNEDLITDPGFNAAFNQLMNFTEVTDEDVKTETIQFIAKKRIFALSSRRAIVVKSGLQYGLARMFQNLRSFEDKNIEIFFDIKEARRWLNLPE